MSGLCITTVVDKEYMAYLPAFVYCVNQAYAHYHVRLFLRDPCPYDLKGWKLAAEIVPMFGDFPRYPYLSIALRFAIGKEFFKEFDYVYVTDIDMMIMPEHRDIEYFHCVEMNQTGLCYSNSLRNANHYAGSESLTGLHFASREWFERTDDLVCEYRKNMRRGILGIYREYDGCMLYRIAKKCNLGLPGKYRLTNRHHGIHMGNFRIFGMDTLKLDTRVPMEFRTAWLRYKGNGRFMDILQTCRRDNEEMERHLASLNKLILGGA